MKREPSVFLDVVGGSPTMRIMQFMIEGRQFDYMLTDLARDAEVSWGTLNKIFPKLVKYGVVKKVRKIGRATLYTINKENSIAKNMIGLYDSMITTTLTGRAEKYSKKKGKGLNFTSKCL